MSLSREGEECLVGTHILVIILLIHGSVNFPFGISFNKACSGEALFLISLPVFTYEMKMIEPFCNHFFKCLKNKIINKELGLFYFHC